jgi:catechol 2,3-dioxygenase-like lactoylglutathione lyase family enzyme
MPSMTADLRLNFVVLYVSDIEASRRYFTETLGFASEPGQSGATFLFLRSQRGGGIGFGLQLASAETPPAGTAEVFLYLDTPGDLEQLRETLTAKGVEASAIRQMPFGTIFSVKSPDGQPLTMMVPRAQ